ncbi:hypothetical protein BKA64DRAFT_777593 [Cadophora sp. MPI-SDFR-AT-0126]|nr:hypothetical protein BKA64DRAFT_777593 [Leotiomycetes sp. MPI-SDFR-AT-0126]
MEATSTKNTSLHIDIWFMVFDELFEESDCRGVEFTSWIASTRLVSRDFNIVATRIFYRDYSIGTTSRFRRLNGTDEWNPADEPDDRVTFGRLNFTYLHTFIQKDSYARFTKQQTIFAVDDLQWREGSTFRRPVLRSLANPNQPKTLSLEKCDLTSTGTILAPLQSLSITEMQIATSSDHYKQLWDFRDLQRLELLNCDVSNFFDIVPPRDFKPLKYLSICGWEWIPHNAIVRLDIVFTWIERLHTLVLHCPNLWEVFSVHYLEEWVGREIRVLDLSTRLPDVGGRLGAADDLNRIVRYCPNLTELTIELDFTRSKEEVKEALQALASAVNLKALNIWTAPSFIRPGELVTGEDPEFDVACEYLEFLIGAKLGASFTEVALGLDCLAIKPDWVALEDGAVWGLQRARKVVSRGSGPRFSREWQDTDRQRANPLVNLSRTQ